MFIEMALAAALHLAGDYGYPVASSPAVVCGASTVPVYDGASGAVVCESANTILGAQQSYYPVEANYGGYFGGYPQTLNTWQTNYYGGGLFGSRGGLLGGLFGGRWGGGHGHGCHAGTTTHGTSTVVTTCS